MSTSGLLNNRHQKYNNFDFIRMMAAWVVLYSHHYSLVGLPAPVLFGIHEYGGLGVLVFFSISGYLVTLSWLREPKIFQFLTKRFLRIWPGLALLCFITVLMVGFLGTNLSLHEYFSSMDVWKYFEALRMKIHYQLPGAFTQNSYPNAVNGSLWTIPIEVKCYLGLCLIGAIGALRFKWLVPICTVFLIFYYLGFRNPEFQSVRAWGREFAIFFLSGASWACLRTYWKPHWFRWLSVSLIVAAISWTLGWRYLGMALALPGLLAIFGEASTPFLRSTGRFGDPSYGMYLYAFPIQQLVLQFGWPNLGFWPTLMISTVLTIGMGYFSWHLLEKRALRLKLQFLRKSH